MRKASDTRHRRREGIARPRHEARSGWPAAVRAGAAAVELAVCLPPIVLLMLGSVELTRATMVQHQLQEAAHAGCRVYSVAHTTQQEAEALVDAAMAQSGIVEYAISFEPDSKAMITSPLQPVSVTVTADFAAAAWLSPQYLAGAAIEGKSTMPADLESVGDIPLTSTDPPPTSDAEEGDYGGGGEDGGEDGGEGDG